MMMVNLLNGDEYACFVVLRQGNTIYHQYLNGFMREFLVFTYRHFSRLFRKIREKFSYIHRKKPRSSASAKVEPRSSEGSLYMY